MQTITILRMDKSPLQAGSLWFIVRCVAGFCRKFEGAQTADRNHDHTATPILGASSAAKYSLELRVEERS